jgi:hypothetical protein
MVERGLSDNLEKQISWYRILVWLARQAERSISGAYDELRVDDSSLPVPPLSPTDAEWAEVLIDSIGVSAPSGNCQGILMEVQLLFIFA